MHRSLLVNTVTHCHSVGISLTEFLLQIFKIQLNLQLFTLNGVKHKGHKSRPVILQRKYACVCYNVFTVKNSCYIFLLDDLIKKKKIQLPSLSHHEMPFSLEVIW